MPRKPSLDDVRRIGTTRVTTRGRKSGKPHTVTTWFLVDAEKVYLPTMNMRRDWTRNVESNGHVELEIGTLRLTGTGRRITDPEHLEQARQLLRTKYWMAWLGAWIGLEPEGVFEVTVRSAT